DIPPSNSDRTGHRNCVPGTQSVSAAEVGNMAKSKLMTQRVGKRPYMDLREFRSHFPVTDNCFRIWIRQGKVPPPIRRLGKLMWKRTIVEDFLERLQVEGNEVGHGTQA